MKYTHKRAIDLAYSVALNSTMRHKVGCVLLSKNKQVIATGFNSSNLVRKQVSASHRANASPLTTCHAEIHALIQAKKPAYRAVVIRVLADGSVSMAKPCKICHGALVRAGIKQVVYSDFDGLIQTIDWR